MLILRRVTTVGSLLGALALASCIFAPGEVSPVTPTCAAGQRFFNGACRIPCATTTDCAGGTHCANIDGTPQGNLCVDETRCAYLEADTECIGVGTYTVYSRFGMETRPYDSDPYWADPRDATAYDDPTFVESPYGPPYASDLGCRGNAHWVTNAPTSDPACGKPHDVLRCRRIGNQCKLVPGTTKDFVAP